MSLNDKTIAVETVTDTEPMFNNDAGDISVNSNDNTSYVYTNSSRVECNLLKILFDMGAPNYAFKEVMNWAKDAFQTGYSFNPKTSSYKNQIMQLQKYNNLEYLRPEFKTLALPNDSLSLQVTCFNFTKMLSPLLNDKDLNKMSNLVVKQVNRFAKYMPPSGKLGEVNSGHWYQQAYTTMIQDVDKDFLLPIIFAMDKTTISSSTNLHIFAVMFTTTIFDWKTRNQAYAWKPLGYIPIDRN